MDRSGLIMSMALGLLAHALIGYVAFPFGDDFAYAPLTEFRMNPELFPRDDQLRLFENHAHVYEWVYRLGVSGPGVETMFRTFIWLQAAATGAALFAILRALGAPLAALPIVLGLGVVVRLGGLGRGDFGGLISPFFHHHNIALTLVLGAFAAALYRKSWLAGTLLGCAAYAQPMTAFHGAIFCGLGALLRNPADALRMAGASIIVALPMVYSIAAPILDSMRNTPENTVTLDLIQDAYRFRSPVHYDPPWPTLRLTTLYIIAGWMGTALLGQFDRTLARFAIGTMAGSTLLHLVTLGSYKLGLSDWIGFYILDATRATPTLFVIGPALALAGIWHVRRGPVVWIAGAVLIAILAFNTTVEGLALAATGALLLAIRDKPRAIPATLLALVAALVAFFPPKREPPAVPVETRIALERIKAETPTDALVVIPISLSAFRHYAQRSAYVDFKLFSVAQPDQAALTRERIDQVTNPAPEHLKARGWPAAHLWDGNQRVAATCEAMAQTLENVGADYYLRQIARDETPPDCPALPRPIETGTLALYGPSG